MNKKFSTLLAGLALATAFTANAKVENGKVYQLTNNGKVLSVTESAAKTDSLVLVNTPAANVKDAEYQKTLWKVSYRFVSLANSYAYTLTNTNTGKVLTFGKQTEWNFRDTNGGFIAPENVTAARFAAQLDKETVLSVISKNDTIAAEKGKAVSDKAAEFTFAAPGKIEMTSALLNNRYGSPFVLTFDKNLDGNPLAGKELFAGNDTLIDGKLFVTLMDKATGKYVVVDSTAWPSNLSDQKFWKLTTDAKPAEKATNKAANVTGDLLKNGRSEELYFFHVVLDPNDNSKMIIYPNATPVYKGTDEEKGSKMCFDAQKNADLQQMIAFGNFAGTEKLTVWSKDPAKSSFAVVEVPSSLDAAYTYYVKDMNKGKKNGKFQVFSFCADGIVSADEAAAIPASMWYLNENETLANMWNINSTKGGVIRVVDEAKSIYSFGEDTVQLVKGPKIAEAQEMAYKKVSKNDMINGALSFRLKSFISENLFVTVKDSQLIVAAGELSSAVRFKADAVELTETESVVPNSNGVKVYKYTLADRLKKNFVYDTEDRTKGVVIGVASKDNFAFMATGVENEFKIVTAIDTVKTGSALTALAGTGMLAVTDLCNTENTLFEFAKKPAPTYASLNIGHVQITSYTEDDNKMVTSQKDGFAVLKAEGQSILKSDVYSHDSLTLWLDTACVEYAEGSMPLYYLSTSAFTEKDADRNFLMNTLDSANVKAFQYTEASQVEGVKVARAAFIPASVCGWDSIAVKGDTINKITLNPAAVAFEVAAELGDDAYRIYSMQKYLNPDFDKDQEESATNVKYLDRPAYLAHLNNVVYWTTDADQAEVFKVIPTSAPTANESIEAESSVKVLGQNGSVVVLGAAGKNVTVATVLGKTVASQVIASDNATIAAPAGVVFVTVDGETTKVVVK